MDNNNSMGTGGLMAVFAVSGSVALLAIQFHKRLLSDFMKKMELEFVNAEAKRKERMIKKVRFAEDVVVQYRRPTPASAAPPNKIKDLLLRPPKQHARDREELKFLPLNWQALYKGIIADRPLKGGAL